MIHTHLSHRYRRAFDTKNVSFIGKNMYNSFFNHSNQSFIDFFNQKGIFYLSNQFFKDIKQVFSNIQKRTFSQLTYDTFAKDMLEIQ